MTPGRVAEAEIGGTYRTPMAQVWVELSCGRIAAAEVEDLPVVDPLGGILRPGPVGVLMGCEPLDRGAKCLHHLALANHDHARLTGLAMQPHGSRAHAYKRRPCSRRSAGARRTESSHAHGATRQPVPAPPPRADPRGHVPAP